MTDLAPSITKRARTAVAPGPDLERRAHRAFDLVQSDPVRAESMLRDIVADPRASIAAQIRAQWGLGRLLQDAGSLAEACSIYDEVVRLACDAGLDADAADMRVNWAVCLQANGNLRGALAQLDAAEPHLDGAELARLHVQRGFVHMSLGQAEAAVGEYSRALPMLREAGDRLGEARLVSNRGIALLQLGRWLPARSDFLASITLGEELGQDILVAGALHNLGYLHGRLGQIPAALDHFDRARARYLTLASPARLLAALDTDHCEVLMSAGLAAEAAETAGRLVDGALDSANVLQLAESYLLRARARLLCGHNALAAADAAEAAALFASMDRQPWVALSTYVEVQATTRLAASAHDASTTREQISRLGEVASSLSDLGWHTEAAEVRILLGRLALSIGEIDTARDELAAASSARGHGPARLRAEAWHAVALLHLARNDKLAARRAISAGLQVVDRHRAGMGAAELRAHTSAHGVGLSQLGVRIALEGGRAVEVLMWAERWRAGSIGFRSAGNPEDHSLVEALTELRRLRDQQRSAEHVGEGEREALSDRIRALEKAVTRRSRLSEGDPRSLGVRIDVRQMRTAMRDDTLVEFVEVDGHLHAVVATESRVRLVGIGPVAAVMDVHAHLLFALRRLCMLPRHHPGIDAAMRSLRDAAAGVDRLLLGPLGLPASGPLVVVPTGALHAIVWSALPTLHGRSSTVAPSATMWLRDADDHGPRPPDRLVMVAGPDVPDAATELSRIGELHHDAVALNGAEATSRATLSALEAGTVAHVAAHGVFRADNPLFSSLRLADGPLMVYDLQRLQRAPRVVVLTACRTAGRGGVLAGDELLGTATALLAMGVGAVVAPVLPVPDGATADLAAELHGHLRSGASPAEALAMASASARSSGGLRPRLAVASSFQCVGTVATREPCIWAVPADSVS